MLNVAHPATMQVVRQAASGVMLKLLVLTEEDLNGLLMSAMLALLPEL